MKRKFLILLAFPLFLFACANEAKVEKEAPAKVADTHEEAHAHQEDSAITLNNGEAWKVDDNMMLHIQNMDKDVAAFSGKTYNDYQVLAMSLQENLDLLTSNCTMSGQAHDELHKWLLPYIDTVNSFAKADNADNAAKEFTKVKEAFKTFNQFFK